MKDDLDIFEKNIKHDRMYRGYIELISKKLNVSFESIHGYYYNSLKFDSNNNIYKKNIFSVVLIFFLPFILLFTLFKINNKKKQKSDIVFEEWREDTYNDYYKFLIEKLVLKYKITRFLSTRIAFNTIKHKYIEIMKYSDYISKKTVLKILKFYFFNFRLIIGFMKLSEKYNMNFIYLFIKFIFAYIQFHSYAKNINSKVFITALDFNSHILKYQIFSQYGIKYFCIQSSTRAKYFFHYKSADIVFCYGKYQSKVYSSHSSNFKEIIPIGSVKSAPYYGKINKKKYDILFAEQYYNFDNLMYAKNRHYIKILSNLIKFSKKYPQYKILYRTREEKRIKNNNIKVFDNILSELKNSSIVIDSEGNSYQKVLESKIVIGYYSTLCFEAIGLNVPAIFCYYDDYEHDLFDLKNSRDDFLLRDNSYNIFEMAILNKLNMDNNKYLLKYKEIYMNQSKNTLNLICEKLEKVL